MSLIPRIALVLLPLLASGCASSSAAVRIESLRPDLQMLRLTDRVWIHVSDDQTDRWGTIPANGMLLLDENNSVLVDTGWRPEQTEKILEFAARTLERPVRHIIVTHAHSDRIGGLAAVTSPEVVVHAQELTAPLVEAVGGSFSVSRWVESETMKIGEEEIELFYPGPGHSRDNAVVWLKEAKILFAGCIVKSGRSADLGNREAAVITAWPLSLLKLLDRYGEAELVIPGHGPPGGLNLIHHTLGLLEQDLSLVTPN